ncbi:MAG: single-stranded DNA-binding protein [Patescibacteria group bacterium]
MYLNKVLLVGNLTRDPELRALPSGAQVASFGMATNRVWKNKEGAKQEAVDFHNIVVFGRQAEIAAQYLKKGQNVLIEGRIQTRSWEKDGVKQYRTEIVADRVQFGAKAGGGGAPRAADDAEVKGAKGPTKTGEDLDTIEYPQEDINPEDIPF